ncbi:MAG: hypothetical protein ACLQJ0_20835 [Steroidobacteraceae bacterium]
MELGDLIPRAVIEVVRDRLIVGVADAEAHFEYSKADEDALTGALGQSISRNGAVTIQIGQEKYTVRTYYRKVRGRGLGAPEKPTGADGIFQIEVLNAAGRSVWTKGLPFQSKKEWHGTDSRLASQAGDMIATTGQGLVIDYSSSGYKACPAIAAVEHGGYAAGVSEARQFRPLGQILGNDFLDCTIGVEGLTYDPESELFRTDEDVHVMAATIQQEAL